MIGFHPNRYFEVYFLSLQNYCYYWAKYPNLVNIEIPNCGRSSTFSMETLISHNVRNQFLFFGNCLNRMVLAFENGVFCPILNLPGPFFNGTSAVTSHRRHAVCWVLAEYISTYLKFLFKTFYFIIKFKTIVNPKLQAILENMKDLLTSTSDILKSEDRFFVSWKTPNLKSDKNIKSF